jgi:hypothetical protein
MKVVPYDKKRPECRRIAAISRHEHKIRGTSVSKAFASEEIEEELDDLVQQICR